MRFVCDFHVEWRIAHMCEEMSEYSRACTARESGLPQYSGLMAPVVRSTHVSPRAQVAITPSKSRPRRTGSPHIFATVAFPVASRTTPAFTSETIPFLA